MSKKDGPELYELLKKGRVELRSSSAKPEAAPPEPIPSQPSPAMTQRPGAKPYPQWRVPFKPAHPTTTGNQSNQLKYNIGFLLVIIALLIVILVVVFVKWNPSERPKKPENPTPAPVEPVVTPPAKLTTTTAVAPVRYWVIRLIWYDDDTAGRASTRNMTKWLDDKGVKASVEKERVKGKTRLAIYTGKYDTPEEAKRQLDKYRRLHNAFRHCEVVEKKAS